MRAFIFYVQVFYSLIDNAAFPCLEFLFCSQICRAIDDIDSRSKILTERYRRELKLRKKYFNELIELKGNIRVHCRVRPTIKEDGTGDQSQIVTDYDLEDDGVIYVEHRGNTKAFEVDKVFRPDSTQEEV